MQMHRKSNAAKINHTFFIIYIRLMRKRMKRNGVNN